MTMYHQKRYSRPKALHRRVSARSPRSTGIFTLSTCTEKCSSSPARSYYAKQWQAIDDQNVSPSLKGPANDKIDLRDFCSNKCPLNPRTGIERARELCLHSKSLKLLSASRIASSYHEMQRSEDISISAI